MTADCFIVVNHRGQCWNGSDWVLLWTEGIQYRRPGPAYELCEQEAKVAEMVTGVVGLVCYLPLGTPVTRLQKFPDLSQVDLRDFARKPEVC